MTIFTPNSGAQPLTPVMVEKSKTPPPYNRRKRKINTSTDTERM